MNINPKQAYVYQPLPPKPDGRFYGVGGLESFDGLSLESGDIKGIDKKSAEEIVKFCNENPDFAANFVKGIKPILFKQN